MYNNYANCRFFSKFFLCAFKSAQGKLSWTDNFKITTRSQQINYIINSHPNAPRLIGFMMRKSLISVTCNRNVGHIKNYIARKAKDFKQINQMEKVNFNFKKPFCIIIKKWPHVSVYSTLTSIPITYSPSLFRVSMHVSCLFVIMIKDNDNTIQ